MKRVTLELGGNAAVVVARATPTPTTRPSGSSGAARRTPARRASRCSASTTTTRSTASRTISSRRFEQLVVGDPLDEATDVGPLISAGDAERVEEWLQEAVDGGARILTGGERDGSVFQPTVIAGAEDAMKVSCEELFAPVIGVYDFSDPLDALDRAGTSEFGLQAGLFTNDMRHRRRGVRPIEVGGLKSTTSPPSAIDHMPYGGVKQLRLRPRGPALRDRGDDRA